MNNRIKGKKSSPYTGVNFNVRSGKWRACTIVKGIRYEAGYYETDREAALALDKLIVREGLDRSKLQILIPKE